MNLIKFIIIFIYLCLTLYIFFYSKLYLRKTKEAWEESGLELPFIIVQLLRIVTPLSVITLLSIAFVIFYELFMWILIKRG